MNEIRSERLHIRPGWIVCLALALCCLCIRRVSAQQPGEELRRTMVSIQVVNQTFDKVFEQIEANTRFKFVYNPSEITGSGKVTISRKNISVEQVLKLLPPALEYELRGRNILITRRETPPPDPAAAQMLRGRVTDTKANPLAGVSVTVKGSQIRVASNQAGAFSIRAGPGDTLHLSLIGYCEQDVPVEQATLLYITLLPKHSALKEVVVIGYGTSSKENLTTAVGTVKGEELNERASAMNMMQGLAGKVAGVSVMMNSGKPGGNPIVKIRGTGSINAYNGPLYVIDGIVGADPMIIDPNIVAAVDVLKDAAASAIYGSRGSNGVIVITTKKGTKNTSGISFRNTLSFGTLARKVELMDASQALEMFKREYEYLPGRTAPHLDPARQFLRKDELFNTDGTPKYNTDWQEEASRVAVSHEHSLALSAGKEGISALVNLSYNDQQGILINSYSRQVNGFINIGWDVKKWLHVQAVINSGAFKQNNVDINTFGLNAVRQIYEFLPFFPVRYADGSYSRKGDYPGAEDSENPVRLMREVKSVAGRTYTMGNLLTTIRFSDKLHLTAGLSGQTGANYNLYYSGRDIRGYSDTQQGVATRGHGNSGSWTSEDYLTWNDQFGKHKLTAVAGASWYYFANMNTEAGSEGFFDDFFSYNSLQTGLVPQRPQSGTSNTAMNSYYMRFNYDFDSRYLFGFSFRADGSSRFGANNMYGYFPSFSAAWRLSSEPFMQDVHSITDLKLRASYGIVGNANIGDYVTQDRIRSGQVVFDGQLEPSATLEALGNRDLKWEKAHQLNFGIDASLFDGRVQFTGDVYNRVTKDLLYYKLLPATTGYEGVYDNIGSIRNRGIELSLVTSNIRRGHFSWNTSLIYSMNRSRVLELNGDIMYPWGGRIMEGRPLNEFYGYLRLGTWGTEEAAEAAAFGKKPGDLKYADLNNNKVKDADDRTVLGNGMPDFETNMANTVTYRDFSVAIDLQAIYGHSLANFTRLIMENAAPATNSYARTLNAWTPQRQNVMNAALRLPGDGFDSEMDSYNIEKGTFLRVRNISFGYRVRESWLKRYHVKSAMFSVNLENYFLFTKYKGYDPEASSFDGDFNQGVDLYQYPKAKTLAFSLNVTF
ncbi:SusC/RagA family TonB-linked outer membrane protein [Chitinophaga sp. GCM10012297]|uniref:SusC/RagA family TonB-linked outer membrane protein n=1 Tax=Chitinophaga chungangae TaxID=2821488 RepID=A0ABS3YJB7_9BACT|nr:SusC/RagA family TonB-linked outer membrane protein [Chitinophaga chungangae]MBO9154744.1 SusC/RagA family TonB-linked outer membrane protein [Chitinophaga chungangae]